MRSRPLLMQGQYGRWKSDHLRIVRGSSLTAVPYPVKLWPWGLWGSLWGEVGSAAPLVHNHSSGRDMMEARQPAMPTQEFAACPASMEVQQAELPDSDGEHKLQENLGTTKRA